MTLIGTYASPKRDIGVIVQFLRLRGGRGGRDPSNRTCPYALIDFSLPHDVFRISVQQNGISTWPGMEGFQ